MIKPLPISSASKQPRAIPGDIIGQVESHIELHDAQDSVGPPTVQRLSGYEPLYEQSLDDLARSLTLEEEKVARDEVARLSKSGNFRPVIFPRNHKTSGFLLLKDLKDNASNRRFIWLNLVPKNCRLAKPARVQDLVDARTGEIVGFTSKTGCLFPIEFGRDYQDEAFLDKGSPLSAKLLKKDGGYEVHIAFAYETPKVEPKTYLGVDRGIYNLASLGVIDGEGEGRILERKNLDGRNLRFVQKRLESRQRDLQRKGKPFSGRRKRHAADETVHWTANEIVDMAMKHESQVIMENLSPMTSRRGKRGRSNFNRVLNRSQYQKLLKVLTYKMAVAGLPEIKQVHPGYTSQACPICGHISKDNRKKVSSGDGFKMDEFRCVECDHADDADLNAARIIALKKIWREDLSSAFRPKPFHEVPENKGFSQFLRVRAEQRGESACDLRVGTSGRSGLDGRYEDGEAPPGGNTVEPRSGSNTPVRKNTPPKQAAVSPSDGNSRFEIAKNAGSPDG